MNWKFFVKAALPWIHMAAESFKNQDDNTTGKDDLIGISLDYAANLIEAVISDKPLPKAPEALK